MKRGAGEETYVPSAPAESELVQLADLAFASRGTSNKHTQAPRNLVFLSPEALDMDLSDPMQRDFGDYELLERIGRGGMGMVYRARQRSLDREVALKLLVAGPWAPTKFIERFRREAQSAARLEHPNIVTVYESGSQHDLNYFSMRLVRGESLATLLARQGPMEPREAARILRIIADAVDYAHGLGVLHLDLKPGNVLIDELGVPLVADFGLARRVDHALADKSADASGTPSYMAPEQADERSQRIGRATDIWGLGSILYELLCDRPPFAAATAEETLERVLHEDLEPPRAHDARIPRDLEAICLKCLRKSPSERYATAADLAEDLRSFLDDRPVSVRRPKLGERMRRWARREPKLAAAVAAVALALLGGLGATGQQWQRAQASALAARQLNWEGRRETALQLEQQGRGLEALERLVGNLREEEEAGALDRAQSDRIRIGLMRGQGARLIDSMVVADANPLASALSPDGKLLALAFNDFSVRWYDAATLREAGRVSLRGRPTSDNEPRVPFLLRFTGAGRLLVTMAWYENHVNPSNGNSWLVDLQRAAVVEPPAQFADFADATFSSNGRWALLRDHAGRVQLWQTTPWSAKSALFDDAAGTLVWLISQDGRLAFGLDEMMQNLSLRDLTGTTGPRQIELPGNAPVTAWMPSADGRKLAIGLQDGRVFLLDVASLDLRQMPILPGRVIRWLAFSEDDAWLAAANSDGLAQIVDVATGSLLVGSEMRARFELQRVAVSHRQRLLVAAGDEQVAMWRIPKRTTQARAAHRIGFAPAAQGLAGRYAIAWSLEQGVLAGAGLNGQVRLWRLPVSPTMLAVPGRQRPDRPYHDDQHVVDTYWNQLRLVSPQDRALTPWLSLAQPPGYAELVDGGRLLLVTVGHELQAYGTKRLSRRYTVELPATPQRFQASPDGRYVLLSFGGHGARGHEEHLRLLDARRGEWLPGDATLAGPALRLAFSPDGQWIVVVGPPTEDGSTSVLRREGLELLAEFPHDSFEPVIWATFQDDHLLLVTRAEKDPRFGRDSLVVWNPFNDAVEARDDMRAAAPLGVIADGAGGAVLAGAEYDLHIGRDGETERLPRVATSDASPLMAITPDGRLLAQGHRYEVQLYETQSGALLGPPLVADIDAEDYIISVSFTPDGRAVFADTILGHQVHWKLEPEVRETEALEAELERLLPSDTGPPVLYALSAAERRGLRAADPGPWPPAEARPAVAMASNARAGRQVPARAEGLSPRLLDLGPVYDLDPTELADTYWTNLAAIITFPIGPQRIAGIDFDIRGVVHIGAQRGAASTTEPEVAPRVECLPLPERPTAAIHVLSTIGLTTPAPPNELLGRVTLHYRDGSAADVPLRAAHEYPSYQDGADGAVPAVFFTHPQIALGGGPITVLSAPRLENPHPEKLPSCLDIEMTRRSAQLAVLAITVEPLGANPP